MIKLRSYQEQALSEIPNTGVNVLSICPGGGKTFTAIQYALNGNFKRILILAHATNVIKQQWGTVFTELDLSFSDDVQSSERFIISIPQALNKKALKHFDLVIVDEAHEYFLAPSVKAILLKTNPNSTLLLTGTPSKLIKAGYNPVIISGVDVYNEGKNPVKTLPNKYLSNTFFGLVKSSYDIKMDEFDGAGDTSHKFNKKTTDASMNALVKEMLIRLKTHILIKQSPDAINVIKRVTFANKMQTAFTALGKTLIAARNIKQADMIMQHLQKNNVKALSSNCDSDTDSENIRAFQENQDIKVLVVVRRGILGFNMPELINVVDFTMSRNIDRIYQLYARVLRTHGNSSKFYFRMCSALNPDVDSYFLQAAMCLNNHNFISKYNGKNLNTLPIIVPKMPENRQTPNSKKHTGKRTEIVSVDAIMAEQILGLELLSELTINSNSKYWKEFASMSFGSVIEKLTGKDFDINYDSIDSLHDSLDAKGLLKNIYTSLKTRKQVL